MSKLKFAVCFSLLFSVHILFAQADYWKKVSKSTDTQGALTKNLENYDLFQLEIETLKSMVPSKDDKPSMIMLPGTENELIPFQIWDAPIMQDGLAAKYPHIKTFLIQNMEQPSMHGRLSITSAGLQAYITSPEEPYFIYPTESKNYVVFKKSERTPLNGFKCGVEEDLHDIEVGERSMTQIGDELRIYRLAVATTGEYSSYHGGNITSVLEAIVETVNQVNVVYENDFAVRFVLVDNNDELINLDQEKDPYDNNSAGQMLGANPGFINGRIGNNSYDLGHVFATGGAGLASLRSSCRTTSKAQGATGIFPPEGNTFSIDYVAHEFGHQLGSNHTFNNCQGQESPSFAFEPGSGSTIMAYAGLCGPNNVQFSSDDYFHVSSLIQITSWIDGTGSACTEMTDLENTVPTVDAGEGGLFIPISTPFKLTAEGADADGDELTYCWEQYNTGPQSNYGSPAGNAPSFRSLKPNTNPTRYFPLLNVVVSGSFNDSEVLPTSSRDLDFQCTVRDNKPGGGAAAWDDISFNATSEAGPFIITSQTEDDVIWETNRLATVTWDVANTDQAPVNCQKVDIIMSKTLGSTFDIILAENVDNNGSHTFFVPDGAESNFAYVMVAAADNIFFNVNSERFKVVEGIASSVDQAFQNSIEIYPNPSDGKIFLNMGSTLTNNTDVEIIDVQGRIMANYTVGEQRSELNLNLDSGVYFLRFVQDNKLAYKKVVITK